jgi:hypothetical protein
LPDSGEARRAFRADKGALKTGHRALLGEQRFIGHAYGGPASGIERVENEEIAEGLRHRETKRYCLGIRPGLALGGPGLEGLHDRRAALRLDGDQPRQITRHPAEF